MITTLLFIYEKKKRKKANWSVKWSKWSSRALSEVFLPLQRPGRSYIIDSASCFARMKFIIISATHGPIFPTDIIPPCQSSWNKKTRPHHHAYTRRTTVDTTPRHFLCLCLTYGMQNTCHRRIPLIGEYGQRTEGAAENRTYTYYSYISWFIAPSNKTFLFPLLSN
jgi:hypothetical protein